MVGPPPPGGNVIFGIVVIAGSSVIDIDAGGVFGIDVIVGIAAPGGSFGEITGGISPLGADGGGVGACSSGGFGFGAVSIMVSESIFGSGKAESGGEAGRICISAALLFMSGGFGR